MINYKELLDKNDLKLEKVTIKKNACIVLTSLGQFVFKENTGIKIYDYLLSRGFDYFPKIIDYNDEAIMFEYIDDIEYDVDERAVDFIKILSFLHSKTAYFKDIDIVEYKSIYENIKNNLDNLNGYYNNLVNIIETKEYMSPSEYLLIRNISIIFSSINYCYQNLEDWFKTIKDMTKKRVVTLYNNIDLNNLLKSKEKIYLINFDKTCLDIPIFDLYTFYKKYGNSNDFSSLLKIYENIFPLSEEEKKLLFTMISIPDKILINNNVNDIKYVKRSINKIYETLNVLNSKAEESTKTHKEENDK